MAAFESFADIAASPEAIWSVLTDGASGPLAGLMVRSIPDLGPSFGQFANGLKARVESGGGR